MSIEQQGLLIAPFDRVTSTGRVDEVWADVHVFVDLSGLPVVGGGDHLSTGVRRCSDASSSGPRIVDPGRVRAWQPRRAPAACQTGAARYPGLAAGLRTSAGFYAP